MKSHMIIQLVFLAGCLFTVLPPALADGLSSSATAGAQPWEKEFHAVCSRTDDAMILNIEELRNFIARCDAMKGQIEKLPEPRRKIFLKRLQMCRDLFVFTIETRNKTSP
jgi:hypothetical protein